MTTTIVDILAVTGLVSLFALAILGIIGLAVWPDQEPPDDPFEAALAAASRLQDHAYRAVRELRALDDGRKG